MSAKVQMMKGNKDPNYSFKESEAGLYHLKMVCKRLIEKEKRFEEDVHIVKVSVKDFAIYRNPDTKKSLGFDTIEILHDPTIAPPMVEEKPEVKEPVKSAPVVDVPQSEETTIIEPIKEVEPKPAPKRKPKPKKQ